MHSSRSDDVARAVKRYPINKDARCPNQRQNEYYWLSVAVLRNQEIALVSQWDVGLQKPRIDDPDKFRLVLPNDRPHLAFRLPQRTLARRGVRLMHAVVTLRGAGLKAVLEGEFGIAPRS
jgi:hypothetical protein